MEAGFEGKAGRDLSAALAGTGCRPPRWPFQKGDLVYILAVSAVCRRGALRLAGKL